MHVSAEESVRRISFLCYQCREMLNRSKHHAVRPWTCSRLLHYESYLYVNMIVLPGAGGKCLGVTMTSAVQTNEQLFMQSTTPHTNICLFSHWE